MIVNTYLFPSRYENDVVQVQSPIEDMCAQTISLDITNEKNIEDVSPIVSKE